MSWLLASLSKEVLPLIVGIRSSFEVWQTLHQAFNAPSETRILQLQMKLQTLKQGDSTISQYLQQVKYIADELAAAGYKLSSSHINAIVFNNLHNDFNGMVTSLYSRATPISFPKLQSLLLSHEICLQNQRTTTTPMPSANYTSSFPGHSSSCPPNARPQGRGRGRGRSNQGKHDNCPVCGKGGQSPYNCRYRHPGSISSQANATVHATAPSSSPSTSILRDCYEWYPDTDATHHTTPNLDAPQQAEPHTGPEHVLIGNEKERKWTKRDKIWVVSLRGR